ncbi:MAG: hypothetical protein HOW73_00785 [Polyangiaceae bacterium]|nr:hypothetical protein [Polyangiaceae bacterium]
MHFNTAASIRIERRIASFIASALPGGAASLGLPFHQLSLSRHPDQRTWWQPKRPLDRRALSDHLAGRIVIAPRCPARLSYFELDLDAKDDAARATLLDRLRAVERAFELPNEVDPAGVVWRSSAGQYGGLRYRVCLDREVDRDELAARVLEQLKRHGLEVRDGEIEVFPRGERGTRAPLGGGFAFVDRDGDELLDPEALEDPERCPFLGFRWRTTERGLSMVRDVPKLVAEWFKRTDACRRPIETVFGPPKTSIIVRVPLYVERKKGAGKPPAMPARSLAWRERIDELLHEGAPAGGRVSAVRDVTFHFVVACGMAEEEAAEAFDSWLDSTPHGSRDLTGPHAASVRAQMRRDARRRVRALLRQVDSGHLTRQGGPARASVPLLSFNVERDPQKSPGKEGWRERLLAELDDADRYRIGGESDPKVRSCLGVLLSSLRRLQRAFPDAEGVAVPREVLQTLATALPKTNGKREYVDPTTGEVVAGYVHLRNRARQLGILGPVLQSFSKAERRATIFMMPPRRVTKEELEASIASAQKALRVLRERAA